jgi:hypothetical protein
MATARDDIRATDLEPPAVRLADGRQSTCGECRFHIPHLTRPGGWCACDAAELRWKLVAAGRSVCRDFAPWPENGNAAWALAEMPAAIGPRHPRGGGTVY